MSNMNRAPSMIPCGYQYTPELVAELRGYTMLLRRSHARPVCPEAASHVRLNSTEEGQAKGYVAKCQA